MANIKINEVAPVINGYVADGRRGKIYPIYIRSRLGTRVCVSRPYKNPLYKSPEETPDIPIYSFTSSRSVPKESKTCCYTSSLQTAREFMAAYYKRRSAEYDRQSDRMMGFSAEAESIEPEKI